MNPPVLLRQRLARPRGALPAPWTERAAAAAWDTVPGPGFTPQAGRGTVLALQDREGMGVLLVYGVQHYMGSTRGDRTSLMGWPLAATTDGLWRAHHRVPDLVNAPMGHGLQVADLGGQLPEAAWQAILDAPARALEAWIGRAPVLPGEPEVLCQLAERSPRALLPLLEPDAAPLDPRVRLALLQSSDRAVRLAVVRALGRGGARADEIESTAPARAEAAPLDRLTPCSVHGAGPDRQGLPAPARGRIRGDGTPRPRPRSGPESWRTRLPVGWARGRRRARWPLTGGRRGRRRPSTEYGTSSPRPLTPSFPMIAAAAADPQPVTTPWRDVVATIGHMPPEADDPARAARLAATLAARVQAATADLTEAADIALLVGSVLGQLGQLHERAQRAVDAAGPGDRATAARATGRGVPAQLGYVRALTPLLHAVCLERHDVWARARGFATRDEMRVALDRRVLALRVRLGPGAAAPREAGPHAGTLNAAPSQLPGSAGDVRPAVDAPLEAELELARQRAARADERAVRETALLSAEAVRGPAALGAAWLSAERQRTIAAHARRYLDEADTLARYQRDDWLQIGAQTARAQAERRARRVQR